jgi:hypothetical protein
VDDGCGGRVAGGIAVPEGLAEGIDCVALEAESHVGVDASGDADAGVAEEFLDDDEVDALSRSRVAVEWRRSWKRIVRSPAPRRRRWKRRVRLPGSSGLPFGVVKTSPLSVQPAPVV